MDIQSAFASGLQGYQRASAGVTDATIDINRQTTANRQLETEQAVTQAQSAQQPRPLQSTEPPPLTDSLVRLASEERNAQANARTIQTADDVLGTVIDIRV